MDVNSGDYIGTYFTLGQIERDNSGTGYWYSDGTDYIPCTNQAFTSLANRTLSLYGTGTEAAVAGIGAYTHMINPWGINEYGVQIG